MGFLDDITKSAKSIASKAVKKTGEVAESAKLAIALRSEESKLEGLFAALGKLTYEKADAALIAAEILEIDEQKNVIKQIKTEIAENSGITRQGVRDVIVRAEAIMTDLEDKTGLMKRFMLMQQQVQAILDAAEKIQTVNYRQYDNPELARLADEITRSAQALKE